MAKKLEKLFGSVDYLKNDSGIQIILIIFKKICHAIIYFIIQ